VSGEGFNAVLPLDSGRLEPLRRRVGSWLDAAGVADDARDAVVLATHEAAANAMEHAQGAGRVTVRGKVEEDVIVVVVTNAGDWREPEHRDGRGRGLALIRAVMSDVDIETDSRRCVVRMRRAL
jgi:serine/threonine-protein kinase RsbW